EAFRIETRESPLFTRDLVPPFAAIGSAWTSVAIAAPAAEVARAVAAEPGARLTIVNTPDEAVVAGPPEAVDRVVARVGAARTVPLTYDMVAHVPEIGAVRDAWRALHRRPTGRVPGMRFYAAATASWYHADADLCADAITLQALTTLDFPKLVDR